MSNVRLNFLNWRPDQEEFQNDGLLKADNLLHDAEGYKQVRYQTANAFTTSNWFSTTALSSIRSMQVRAVGAGGNRVAAIVKDFTTTPLSAHMEIGVEGQAAAFTTVATGTLISAGGCKIKSFGVAELGSGEFVAVATFLASLADGGSTTYAISGEAAYTLTSESEGSAPTLSTSLDGTQASHSNSTTNAVCYAGVYLKNDGNEYSVSAAGVSEGTLLSGWLTTGLSSDAYIHASLTNGTLYDDAGTGSWLPLTTSRKWSIQQASDGTSSAVLALQMASDGSGSNVVDTATYTLTAIRAGVDLNGSAPSHVRSSSSGACTAGVYLKSDGVEYSYTAAGTAEGTNLGSFVTGLTVSTLYVKCTLNSGDALSGSDATGSWIQLNTSRGWKVVAGIIDTKSADMTIQVATDSGGTNIVDTKNYYIEANGGDK